ncbi:S1/P1 nuclease [Idiomarina tyrosinivorans]|uniref:S1/P1 nuclease n=1 Tax=Idiomarina tyrosinivorans TaxID=1445662 RepID=UPI00130070A7|nr:S1/P1 nuclease [Idiomarina tyrosinivorans]
MIRNISLLSLLFLFATLSQPAQAYGKVVHQAICQLAYDQLPSSIQQNIDNVVKGSSISSFAEGCSWPDDIKHQDGFRWTASHHYVNVPFMADHIAWQDCPASGCVMSAIRHHYDVLQSDPQSLASLLFLGHFVADMHQPLHVSYAEDKGGNTFDLSWQDKQISLHWLWDGILITPQQVAQLPHTFTADPMQQSLPNSDILAWANESVKVTHGVYQALKPNTALSPQAFEHYQQIDHMRAEQAANRLAQLLTELYQ